MPSARGSHKVKPAKTTQVDVPATSGNAGIPFIPTKPTRRNTDWRTGILKPILSRSSTETKLTGLVNHQATPAATHNCPQAEVANIQTRNHSLPTVSVRTTSELESKEANNPLANGLLHESEQHVQPVSIQNSSLPSNKEEDTTDEAVSDTFEDLTIEETQSNPSSYSRDVSSVYSSDSSSIYSSTSSIYSSGASVYSSGASMYSFDEEADIELDCRIPGRSQYQHRTRTAAARRPELQDAASRERSTLARKAAMFKNSRLPPQLPSFSTSLPTWSMVCRAAEASYDCYDSRAFTRRGIYIPADTSRDIKAMIIDDQVIDDSRVVIVSIRGTQVQSLADWAVNKAANPTKPVGFLDDEENACHAGFLQVTRSMMVHVAAQLQQHSVSSQRPGLLFTGHSAGGAVAAMLYSHMLSTTVSSDLTALASQFASVNCITFGAPPLSLTPLPKRDHGLGVFLAFANEGDPVLRLSNAAYVKSLAKLMTTSPPSSVTAAPPVKVVRGSRGTRVIRQIVPTVPLTPWEELPLWPTPPAPLANAGEVILLRDMENGGAIASQVTCEELGDVIFGDLAQHTIEAYIRRVKEVAFAALVGRTVS